MSKCPQCGRPGKRSGRIFAASGQLELEVTTGKDRRHLKAVGTQMETVIYRCRGGHRWEAASVAAFNSSMQALFARVKGGK